MRRPLILAIETSSRIGSVAIAFGERLVFEARFCGPFMHSAEIFPAVHGLLVRAGRSPKQIEQIYISGGPGSFTGLRIAATIAKTMHLANTAKIITVNTLDIIASNVVPLTPESTQPASNTPCKRQIAADSRRSTWANRNLPSLQSYHRIAVVLDAKRGQFFIAVYERCVNDTGERQGNGIWRKSVPDSLMTISEFLNRFVHRLRPIGLLGDGLVYYKDKFKADGVSFLDQEYWSPQANKVHLLGWQMALNGQFTDPLTLTPNYLRKPDITLKPR